MIDRNIIYFVLLAFKDNLLAQNHLYNWFNCSAIIVRAVQ